MKKQYCAYCGVLLSDGCSCERDNLEEFRDVAYIEERDFDVDPLTAYNERQQDIIDWHRNEK